MEIKEILKKYDSDKETFHLYGSTYDTIFKRYNREDELNILEVGTQKGGSLQAWKEYFPNAHVYGLDIVDVVSEDYRKDNVTRIISDVKDWKNNLEWDIVIDDGSHYLLDVAFVVSKYILKLRVGGVIVIEDVRFPSLILRVIENLLSDIGISAPNITLKDVEGFECKVECFDTSAPEAPGSFIIAIFKDKK